MEKARFQGDVSVPGTSLDVTERVVVGPRHDAYLDLVPHMNMESNNDLFDCLYVATRTSLTVTEQILSEEPFF